MRTGSGGGNSGGKNCGGLILSLLSALICRRRLLRSCLAMLLIAAALLLTASATFASQPAGVASNSQPPERKSGSGGGSSSYNNRPVHIFAPIHPVRQRSEQPPPPSPPPQSLSAAAASPIVANSSTKLATGGGAASGSQPVASQQTREFLGRVTSSSANIGKAGDPVTSLVAALKSKLPLLNRLSGLTSATDRSLLDRAKSCAPTRDLALKHVQNFAYLHNEPDLCSGQLLIIAAVHSNAVNFNRRATIRRTWGSLRYIGASRLQLVFFLGRQENPRIQRDIEAESRRYRDLVQLDYQEHYRNMSLKHLGIYEWVLAHCSNAQYLLKADDDTFTDVVHLVTFLQQSPPEGFYCSNTKGAKPQRLKRGPKAKWVVSRSEFPGAKYPAYCEGFGYVVRTAHLTDLYICSLFHKFFWIDDVYVTGVLPAAAKVPLDEFWKGHGYTGQLPSLASEKILDYIFLVADHNEFLDTVWQRLWRAVLQFSLDLTL